MRNLVGWILIACVGCSENTSPSQRGLDASTVTDTAPPTGDGTSLAPGVYGTITGGEFAGTYALTQTVECNVDVETNAFRFFGGDANHDLSLFSTTQPESGQTESSPDFWVIVTDDNRDAAYYPQDTGGSCMVIVDQGWPVARVHFSCTGGSFMITDGIASCPDA